jgi:hypothetical protein
LNKPLSIYDTLRSGCHIIIKVIHKNKHLYSGNKQDFLKKYKECILTTERDIKLSLNSYIFFQGGNGGGGGGGGSQTPISHPPSFSQPCRPRDLQENYNIGTGQNNVIVNWTVPSATDEDNDIPRSN